MAVFDVTIDGATHVPVAKTDIPILIDLSDMPAAFWSTVTSGGGDIRCYESDGVTELAREVVSCNTGTSTGELWVKVTNLGTGDTVIKIDVDGARSEPAFTATYGRNAVWSDYEAVWHLNETATGGSGSIIDSTGNGHDGTPSGWGASGQVASPWGASVGALDFDGSNDWISVPDDPGLELLVSGGPNYLVQHWANPDASVANILMAKVDEWSVFFNTSGTSVGPRFNTYGDNNLSVLSSELTTGVWSQVVFWGDPGASHKTYTNKTLRGTKSITDTSAGTSNVLEIGRAAGGTYANGKADEIRIATGTRADALDNTDWQTIEYNNVVNIATFYSVAAASSGITGTLTKTQASDAISSAGTLAIDGDVSLTQAGDTIAATAALALSGSLSATQAGDTLDASGVFGTLTTGDLNATQAGDTIASAGTLALAGDLDLTQAGDTVTAAATLSITGEVSTTQEGDSLTSTGFGAGITGELNVTQEGDTVVAYQTTPGSGLSLGGGLVNDGFRRERQKKQRARLDDDAVIMAVIEQFMKLAA